MARQLSLPGIFRSPKDLSTEQLVKALPEAARPVYLEALHRAAQLRPHLSPLCQECSAASAHAAAPRAADLPEGLRHLRPARSAPHHETPRQPAPRAGLSRQR